MCEDPDPEAYIEVDRLPGYRWTECPRLTLRDEPECTAIAGRLIRLWRHWDKGALDVLQLSDGCEEGILMVDGLAAEWGSIRRPPQPDRR
jgi:hypothetical protein